MTTIVIEQQQFAVAPAAEGPGLWLSAADMKRVTGFSVKPEGLCKEAICVPVPRGHKSFVKNDAVDAAAFWRHIGNPVVQDEAVDVWVLGIGASARTQVLEALEAPEFYLPDLNNHMHSLSTQRGKKIFLATWASW